MSFIPEEKSITQFATMKALLVGLYDGVFPVSHLIETGCFGLGCSHGMAGEMIIIDGKCYDAKSKGPMIEMSEQEQVPFAQVADFKPEQRIDIEHVDKVGLMDALAPHLKSPNLLLAILVEAEFDNVKIRRPQEHSKPYLPLLDVMATQVEDRIEACRGRLIGFWTPEVFQGVSVAGLHLHFIDDNKKIGGHVLDFNMKAGVANIETYSKLDVVLPSSGSYLNANLTYDDMDAHIKKVEG